MADKLMLKLAGLYSAYNSLGSVPDGALLTANNIVIDKDNIGEIRRGYKIFGEAMGNSSVNTTKQLLTYKDVLLRNYETATRGVLEYQDSVGSTGFTQFTGLKYIFADSVSASGTTVTFNTEKNHGMFIGDEVVIEGASPSGYNGTFTVTSVPSVSAFTYITASAQSAASGTPLLYESSFNGAYQVNDIDKIRSVEVNSNLYFTNPDGIKKIDTFNATIVNSGVSKAFDAQLELFNDSTGFFQQETQVGYRIVWGYKDINDNLLLGAASSRTFISNPGLALIIDDVGIAGSTDASLIHSLTGEAILSGATVTAIGNQALSISADLTAVKSSLNAIASAVTADAAITAPTKTAINAAYPITGNTLLIIQSKYDDLVTALDSDAGLTGTYNFATTAQNVELTITIPDGVTNNHFYQVYRSTQSIAVNALPNDDYQLVYEANPINTDLKNGFVSVLDEQPEEFKGAALYQNPEQETDAQANDLPPFATDIALFNGITFYSNTKTVHKLQFTLVGLDPLTIGSSTLVVTSASLNFAINFGASENVVTSTARLYSDGTPAQNIANTAKSIVNVVNRCNPNTFINAYYLSGPNDAPGLISFDTKTISNGSFTLNATNSTIVNAIGATISAYNPDLETVATSSNEEKTNRIYYSKANEPEAVPLLNYLNVGGGDNVIKRIAALRDSLFIFSTNGIFKISGNTTQSLVLSAFDNTTLIASSNSLVRGNTQIFLFSSQGIITVSDTGIDIISRQVEDQLLPLLDSEYTGFQQATFGLFYQTDRKYILFTVQEQNELVATVAWVFNTFTNSWVKWTLGKTAGIVNPADDKLYLGASDTNYIEQERKNFSYTDHADREHDTTILTVSTEIASIAVGTNQSIITATLHGLLDGDTITITDSNSTPNVDGSWEVQIINVNQFAISQTITVAGTTGTWVCTSRTVPMVLGLNSLSNTNVGDVIKQDGTQTVNSTTYSFSVEVPVVAIDATTNSVTLGTVATFIPGPAKIFDFIAVEVEWTPITAGDPGSIKHYREFHLMFDKFYCSDVQITCYSDIQINPETVNFDLTSFGNWGKFNWGKTPWSGRAAVRNIRTYIPLGKQKARLLNVVFRHEAAREKWRLEGAAVIYRELSIGSRTNRT